MTDAEVAAFVHRDENAPDGSWAVGVKDLFRVDGMPTRAGSRLPAELFEGPEARVVGDLRRAGATIVGKTAMDEFAYCEPPATRNPCDLRRTPGGSSGGSAAAVASGMCQIAVGSQTLKSVIVPASFCGVIGYVPTYGRVPFDGVPLSPSFDTVGFLAADLKVLQAVTSRVVPKWRDTGRTDTPVLGVPARWGSATCCMARWRVHAGWFARFADSYRPRTLRAVERGRAVSDGRVAECREAQEVFRRMLHESADHFGVDAWICPSSGSVAPLGYEDTGDSWMTAFWSFAGWPSISLPVFDGEGGLPHGLQVVAPAGRDEELLSWAAALQSRTWVRRPKPYGKSGS